MPQYGYSFQPGQGGGQDPRKLQQRPGGPQSAIEVRSLSLPARSVPGAPAPQQLLQGYGGGGGLDVNILRRLISLFAPVGQQPGVAGVPDQFNNGVSGLRPEDQANYAAPSQSSFGVPNFQFNDTDRGVYGTGNVGSVAVPVAPYNPDMASAEKGGYVSPGTAEGFDMSGAVGGGGALNPYLAEKYSNEGGSPSGGGGLF